jgi:Domain of unknown function (DUF4129)
MSTHASSGHLLAGGPGIGRIPARNLARRELARSMYHPSWLARVIRDIGNWLSSLLSTGPGGRPSWWAIVLLSVVVLAAIAAVLYWLGPARLTRRLGSQPLVGDRTMTAAEYRDAAESLAGGGNYQAAIIERVRAIAAALDARGILLPRPARTAAELAAETAAVFPAETAGLVRAARLFDEVRYGGRVGTQAGYAEVTGLDLRLDAAANTLPARSVSRSSVPGGSLPGGSLPGGSASRSSVPGSSASAVADPGSDGTSAPPGMPPLGPVLTGRTMPTGTVPTGTVPTSTVPSGSVPTGAALTSPGHGDRHSQQTGGSG